MKKITNCILFLFLANSVIGQQYSGVLSKPKAKGLHLINVTPHVRSACKDSLDYFRILDQKKVEVPYAKFSSSRNVLNLKTCKIIEKNVAPNKLTSVVVENTESVKLDRLLLKIGNSSVSKHYNISGSYDNKEWFGLVYNQEISNLNQDGQTNVDKEFLFPLNSYKYIKFDFIDTKSLPINVISAYYLEEGKMEVAPSINLTDFDYKIETDKQRKVTEMHITFKEPQVINGVRFEVGGPSMYLREAKIVVNKTYKIKRQKTKVQETLSNFELKSNGDNFFEFAEFFEKEFIIEIENQDNPVLDIKSIELLQRPLQVIADLNENEKYKVVLDSNYTAPSYDIVNFNLNSKDDLPSLNIENFEKLKVVESSKGVKFWQMPWFLWTSIIIGGILIAYFAFGLLKDLEKKN